jgi:hypothetical protein
MIAWHWMSAALALAGLLLFALTGVTLNHADLIRARPQIESREILLPAPLRATIAADSAAGRRGPLPDPLDRFVRQSTGISGWGDAEWSNAEIYLAAAGPGRDAWVSIDRHTGLMRSETTDRGVLAFANDLHKGRNTGPAWRWMIDLIAGACILFALTGLMLLVAHGRRRRLTWPLVAGGAALPAMMLLFLLHH